MLARAIAVGAGLAALIAAAACGDLATDPEVVGFVNVLPSTLTIYPGEQRQLDVGVVSTPNRPLRGRTPTFASADTRVATVSQAGVVTAIAQGDARISAEVDGIAGVSTVRVLPIPVATVSVDVVGEPLWRMNPFFVGGTRQLAATTKDATGAVLTGRVILWTSSAPQVATVSESGLVRAVGPGPVRITATSEGKSGFVDFTAVATRSCGVLIDPYNPVVAVGRTVQLSARGYDAIEGPGVPCAVVVTGWRSSDQSIATVDGTGLVRGVAPGTAMITVTTTTAGTASAIVTVLP